VLFTEGGITSALALQPINKSYGLEGILKLSFSSPVSQLCYSSKHGDGTRCFYAIEIPADWKLYTMLYQFARRP